VETLTTGQIIIASLVVISLAISAIGAVVVMIKLFNVEKDIKAINERNKQRR